jgi:RNA polymerase sigma-70 factor, ECF subfamily
MALRFRSVCPWRPGAPDRDAGEVAEPPAGTGDEPFEALSAAAFKAELTEVIPHLRAFARSLSGDADQSDDLVQETLLKAWGARERFRKGTSMRAWTFVILRNTFYSKIRRAKFSGEYDEITAERKLSAPAPQQDALHLADVQRALLELSLDQREAIVMVGAGGLSYAEAAKIAGCAVGTMKSRVSRARAALEELLESGSLSTRRAQAGGSSDAFDNIVGGVCDLLT